MYAWETQNLQLKMDVLQCNIVKQMVHILEGLVPQPKEEEQAVALSVHESVEGKIRQVWKSVAGGIDLLSGKATFISIIL